MSPRRNGLAPLGVLTPRERDVMRLLAEGATVNATAAALGIAPKTADSHKSNLMRKLGVHNRATLTIAAVRAGLVRVARWGAEP